VLRRIFVPKRDEVTGGWRKLHNEELHNLYASSSIIIIIIASGVGLSPLYCGHFWPIYHPSIIRMIKSSRMRWAGHVARMGEKRNAYRILVGKQEDQGVSGWTILKCILER
jgi:hypothetical protein